MLNKTTDDLIRIVSFGGGVTIDGAAFTVDDLCKIASFGGSKPLRIVIHNANRIATDDLCKIAAFGKGSVRFE
jgi:hypothetical protein